MNDSYLQHHGIKGMKWGVRRFRNEDGTLTEAGKKRYGDVPRDHSGEVNKAFGNLAKNGRPVKRSMTKEELARAGVASKQGGKIVSGSQDVVRGVRKAVDTAEQQPRNRYNKRPNLTQEEMDKMSDKELRELVNRLNLEQQYSDLTKDNVARSKLSVGLDYAEAALTIAGGALSIAAAYKVLRG